MELFWITLEAKSVNLKTSYLGAVFPSMQPCLVFGILLVILVDFLPHRMFCLYATWHRILQLKPARS